MRRFLFWAVCLALSVGSASASMAVRMDGAAALLDTDGAVIVDAGVYEDIASLGGELFAATADGARYALLGADGTPRTGAVYDELRLCGDRLAARRDGGWGLLDRDGAELGAFDYVSILADESGNCWALREEDGELTACALGADGRERGDLRALRAGEPGRGLLPLEFEGGRWGYCDAEGALAIPARFEWAGRFAGGVALAVEGGCYGAIDGRGAWVVAPEHDFIEISDGGLILAAGEEYVALFAPDGSALAEYAGEGVWGALAGEGYVIGDGEALRVFDGAGELTEELAPDAAVSEGLSGQLVISEGMWGEECVRLSGTEAKYQNLYPLGMADGEPVYACMEVRAARYQNDLLHEVQVSVDMESARYGLVDGAGEVLLPCGYTAIWWIADDRFLVQDGEQWRVVNSWGKVYWRSSYGANEEEK